MLSWLSTLRARLLLWAGLIGLVAILASALTVHGTARLTGLMDAAVSAEQRMQRFSVLADQIGSFLVVAYEAAQAGVDAETRATRLDGLTRSIAQTFAQIRQDLDQAITAADASGFDERTRMATRSLGIARMEALFNATSERFLTATTAAEQAGLQGQINSFSIGFDPLLNAAITEERRARDAAIAQVGTLRDRLSRVALLVGALAIVLVSGFYLGLVRPQLSRLDRLLQASGEIARENFAVVLPETRDDEIGKLFAATNRMTAALSRRKAEVADEWQRLNQTIDERTQALRSANAALEKADEDRRRFFADVSHELRTPLTVILMEAELALKAGAPEDGPWGVVQGRARRLNRRIDDLLRIARSESGTLTLEDAAFDLHEAAAEALADMRAPVESAGMTLTLEGAAPVPVRGDRNWVRQVAAGLIENSLRHARGGGAIRLTTGAGDGFGWLRVADNGAGIDPDEIEAVMQRFGQGRGGARAQGFGIGLALARWIVTEQGGRIVPESPVPAPWRIGDAPGTMVTVFLPDAGG